jgi:two-component system chemotaxis response regulator CheB
MTSKTRVLVVDDSALARAAIKRSLAGDPTIEVVALASDAYDAREKILLLRPDVITLDLEMPMLDGLSFLRILKQHYPIPVIVISSLTPQGSAKALEALECGAFDVLGKNKLSAEGIFGSQLGRLIRAAAESNRNLLPVLPDNGAAGMPAEQSSPVFSERRLLVIGSSTGGVEALRALLPQLPEASPPIVVVQHIPSNFSRLMAERLNELCRFEVREAVEGDVLRRGLCLIAPGDYHLLLGWTGSHYKVRLTQSPPVHHCRPAVDVLFRSAAECAKDHAVGVLLTGMGTDGARGLRELRSAGAHTIAQDEKSSVVYGMPQAAVKLGAVVEELPLSKIPLAIQKALGQTIRK